MRRALIALITILTAAGADAQGRFGDIDRDLLVKHERPSLAQGRDLLLAPQPTPEQTLSDVLHYDVDIAVHDLTELVEGRVTAIVASTADSLFQIVFNADPALTILSVWLGEPASPAAWLRSGDIMTADLPVGLADGESTVITIYFEGSPASAADPGLFFREYNTRPIVYSLSEPWGSRSWWPCKDYPDDKATFDIALSVRAPLFAASNGDYLGEADTIRWGEPFRRYHWRENYPMPPYLMSISASEYFLLTDHFVHAPGETMLVTNYVYPELIAEAAIDLDITVPALEFFSSLYGMYPFVDEKYGVAVCQFGGGMEHQTLTSYGSILLTGDHRYDWLWIHELGHQWFGDLITCADWTHIWLNEGWASYTEALWFEHLGGPGDLRDYMQTMDTPAYWDGDPVLRDPYNPEPWYYFDRIVYDKGAWIVHMLRRVMGDAAFFEATRAYVADSRFRYGTADTEQFEALFETYYGGPLDWFFDEWLLRTDRLTYEWGWTSWESEGSSFLSIHVSQLVAEAYEMPVDFRITTAGGEIDTALWVDDLDEYFLLETGDPATAVQFDPDGWILCDASSVATGTDDTPAATYLSQNWPNPFNPATTLRFGLGEPGRVTVRVYDIRGALVRTLVDGTLGSGSYETVWNGLDSNGNPASSGIYFCRMDGGGGSFTKKMVLLR